MADVLMTQLAACRRAVGIALSARPEMQQLRGRGPDLDAMGLALTGVSPRPGDLVVAPWGWWMRTSAHRAVLLADVLGGAAMRRAVAAVGVAAADVAVSDCSPGRVALVLAGPRAGRLAAVGTALLPSQVVAAADGEDYHVVLVPADTAEAAYKYLLAAGRNDGAIAVDLEAVRTLRIADRVTAGQRPPHPVCRPIDPIWPRARTPLSVPARTTAPPSSP